MRAKYTKRQIIESIKHWERELQRMDESLRVSLADKHSAAQALIDHNDELTAFIEQKPHPTRDELIQFVADIFKEEGLDTPWTRQFLIKLKMYTHGWDDIVQYLWNARLKGIKLGMDQGKHPWANEEEDFQPKIYFVQLFKSDEKGNIDKSFDSASQPDGELKYLASTHGLDRTFKTKAEAVSKAKTASRRQALDFLNDDLFIDDDEAHCLAVVRQGDDWGSDVVACFIDGILSPVASISKQLSDVESVNEADNAVNECTIDELIEELQFAKDSIGGYAPVKIRSFNDRSPMYDDVSKVEIQGNFAYIA